MLDLVLQIRIDRLTRPPKVLDAVTLLPCGWHFLCFLTLDFARSTATVCAEAAAAAAGAIVHFCFHYGNLCPALNDCPPRFHPGFFWRGTCRTTSKQEEARRTKQLRGFD